MAKRREEPARFFRLRNWEKYQEYHSRNRDGVPPWIKLSTQFFDDAGVAEIPESQRLCLVAVLIMAAKCRNRVLYDPAYIAKRCGLRRQPDLELFQAHGFIEICDVATAPPPEEQQRTRGEERREEEKQTLASSPAREADDSGPPTPATPAEAREGALSVLGAPSPPEPLGDVFRHQGRDYRAGDTLPDGRRVESVADGVPVLVRASAAGAPGELEAAQRELLAELERAAKALRLPADAALARYSRTPSGAVITNPWNCTRLPWLRTTLEKLRGARLSAEADAADTAPPESARDEAAERERYLDVRLQADRYAVWCRERGLPVDHRESTEAWLRETGTRFDELEMAWFIGERRRLAA